MTDGHLTAALEDIKGRRDTRIQYSLGFDPVDGARLLAALEAAIGFHVEAVIEDMPEPRFRYCETCSGHPAWPCPEVTAITRALNGGTGG